MSYTLPPDTRISGNTGHISDHNNIVDVLTGTGATYNILNTVFAGGADPTGAADSTSAIQAAITAAANVGQVLIPPGTYKLSATLAVPTGSIIRGTSKFASTLHQTSTTANAITFTGTTNDVLVQLEDLSFTGPGSGSGYGLYGLINSGNNNLRLVLRNLVISSFGSSGMYLRSPITSVIENVLSQSNGVHGFYINNGTSTTFIGNWALNNLSGIGYYFQGGTYWAMEGCASDFNALGYQIAGVVGMSLNGCGCESINAAGGFDGTYYKITGSSGVTLNGCYAFNNSAVAFWTTAASTSVTYNNCTETQYLPNAPTASFKTDTGTMSTFNGYEFQTAIALTGGTYNELNDGTTGEMSIAGNTFTNNLLVGGILTLNQSGTAPVLTNGGTIATAGLGTSRVAPGGAVTGIILASGTDAGQAVTVINQSAAANTIQFAAAGTSHVADGTGTNLAGLTARSFVWDSATSLWYRTA